MEDQTGAACVAVAHARRRDTVQVQIQLDAHGDRASEVADYLAEHWPHVDARCTARPGLCVTITVPSVVDGGFSSWREVLVAALSPVDVALEIVATVLGALDLGVCEVLSLHLTH